MSVARSIPALLAYLMVFIGAVGLLVAAMVFSGFGKLAAPLREQGLKVIALSLLGVSLPYLAFHWALDFASIVQVDTLVTTIPIFVGLCNLLING
jgi:drug/metabolite transporter (DMT)-like permease